MTLESHQPATSAADLYKIAESVVQNGRRQIVVLHGKKLAIVPQESRKATLRRRNRENGFLAAYGSVRPLAKPLTDSEITEIAAEEAAQEAARSDLVPNADD